MSEEAAAQAGRSAGTGPEKDSKLEEKDSKTQKIRYLVSIFWVDVILYIDSVTKRTIFADSMATLGICTLENIAPEYRLYLTNLVSSGLFLLFFNIFLWRYGRSNNMDQRFSIRKLRKKCTEVSQKCKKAKFLPHSPPSPPFSEILARPGLALLRFSGDFSLHKAFLRSDAHVSLR